jgi:hypothetical protein
MEVAWFQAAFFNSDNLQSTESFADKNTLTIN